MAYGFVKTIPGKPFLSRDAYFKRIEVFREVKKLLTVQEIAEIAGVHLVSA